MPDARHHRGPHPEDDALFAPERILPLRRAVADLSWLLTRHYAVPGALKVVGDRYRLSQRQRTAVMRCACADEALVRRRQREVAAGAVVGQVIELDGYNVLTTVEAGLAGGVILIARDGCCRDMASIHGTYRKVDETIPALELAGRALAELGVVHCRWYLDSPVSNSGRLKDIMLKTAAARGWNWSVELATDPDVILAQADGVITTADSVILDRCGRWLNLAKLLLDRLADLAWIVDLRES